MVAAVLEFLTDYVVSGVVLFAILFVAFAFSLHINAKQTAIAAFAATLLLLVLVEFDSLFGGNDDKPLASSTSFTSSKVTAKDLPFPEVGIPGHVPPEGKTVHLNYEKGEAPVAISCREVGGKVECKPAR